MDSSEERLILLSDHYSAVELLMLDSIMGLVTLSSKHYNDLCVNISLCII